MKTLSSLLGLVLALSLIHSASADEAGHLLELADFNGGLVVHAGCGDGTLTAALADHAKASVPGDFLLLALDRSGKARERLASRADYGDLSVAEWSGDSLPLIDNQVNLLIVEKPETLSKKEIQRVLAPRGVALLRRGDSWRRTVKPWPKDIDEWTHYLHSPGNNAVAQDDQVGPPHHLQWVGSPTWTRHHDHMSSFNAMVSAAGRVFYIMDLGPRAEVQLPSEWALVCRDAFNGVQLWQRGIDRWHSQLWNLKSGPAQIPRRLVAIDNRVYVTLGIDAPVSVLDAISGKTLQTLKGTEGTEEILYADGLLYLVINPKAPKRPWATKEYANLGEIRGESEQWAWKKAPRKLSVVNPETGRSMWSIESPVLPMTLTLDDERVYFHDGEKVQALDRKRGGDALWTSTPIARAQVIRSWFAPTLVAHDGVLVFSGGEKMLRHKGGVDSMTALDGKTGKVLWTAPHPASGYDSPEDVFVIDGIVWTAPLTNKRDTGLFTARDLRTGKVRATFPANDGVHMPHHRCHRAKATHKYIVASRTGIEYVDLKEQDWDRNDWVRGACLYGLIPANGLTYAPQHSCACYIVAKLNGMNALASKRSAPADHKGLRLTKGPAFDLPVKQTKPSPDDWPTFRGNNARSGRTPAGVADKLKVAWDIPLGGRLSGLVAADGRVYVAQIDAHRVHALDLETGNALWQFTAGGRVDSPPTIWNNRVLFGSNDGHVYCLDAKTGELAWRFRAAPADMRLQAWEQVESVWPVHGSVLVIDGEVHAVAGRSMFLDGGLHYLRLNAANGKLISKQPMGRINPDTGRPLDADITWPNLPVGLPDILSFDGTHIYMRSQVLDKQGNRIEVKNPTTHTDQKGTTAHLFCPTGFLDDSWWHRTYWIYGKNPMSAAGGWYLAAYAAPAGRIMVFDDERVYAFGRRPQYFPRTTSLEYHLYSAPKQPEIVPLNPNEKPNPKSRRKKPFRPVYDWTHVTPVLGRALAMAGDTLFVAGPPDVVDQEASLVGMTPEEAEPLLARQRDAYEGKAGGILLAVSTEDGSKQAAYALDTIPVFDGLAAADGRLLMTTVDGRVLAFAGKGTPLPPADVSIEPTPTTVSPDGVAVTTTHKDFDHIDNVRIETCDFGWHLHAPKGGVGVALRELEKPINGPVTFKLRVFMHPLANSKGSAGNPPGNAFLAFGARPDDASLIKCGLRNAGQVGQIVEDPLLKGNTTSTRIESKVKTPIDLTVTYDPGTGKVTSSLLGETTETTLKKGPKRIAWVGYVLNSVSSEFGKIEIATGE